MNVRAAAARTLRALACAAAAFVVLAGCDGPPVEDTNVLVAHELRALRESLERTASAAATGGEARGAAPAADPGRALADALAPLREAMTTLGTAQSGLQQRQVALAQELGRWSALLANTVRSEDRADLAALQERLQQLERQLQEQDQRHRDVEALVQQSLDRASQRLEAFLQIVQQLPREASPTPGPAGSAPGSGREVDGHDEVRPDEPSPAPRTGGDREAAANDAHAAPSPLEASHAASPPPGPNPVVAADARLRGQESRNWLLAVLAAGLLAVGVLALRLARPAMRHVAAGPAEFADLESAADRSLDDRSADERSAEELWLAASLLGEAVGRLRQARQEPPLSPSASASPSPSASGGDEGATPDGADARDAGAGDAHVGDADRLDADPAVDDEVFVLDEDIDALLDVDSDAGNGAADHADAADAAGAADATATAETIEGSTAASPDAATAASPDGAPYELPRPARPAPLAPTRLQVILAAGDRQRARATVASFLARDPRILRRPAPEIVDVADGLRIGCSLLPGLQPGELEHVRWQLQALARG